MKTKWFIGIDEAGRGPLAGPVAVGVFAVRKNAKLSILKKVKDSKKCLPKLREKLYLELKKCNYAVGFASAAYIDKHGIVPAIKLAMSKALAKLNLDPCECEVSLDGSLRAPAEYKNQKTIIKGDALVPVISAASICAKVVRDRRMTGLGKKYPLYRFEVHKGYGTLAHRKAIGKYGVCKEHRLTYTL